MYVGNLAVHTRQLVTLYTVVLQPRPSIDGSQITGELDIQISGISLTILKAENVLLWQRNNGGWPKEPHNDFSGYDREQTASEKTNAQNTKNNTDTTIDNNHTIGEIRILLNAFNIKL